MRQKAGLRIFVPCSFIFALFVGGGNTTLKMSTVQCRVPCAVCFLGTEFIFCILLLAAWSPLECFFKTAKPLHRPSSPTCALLHGMVCDEDARGIGHIILVAQGCSRGQLALTPGGHGGGGSKGLRLQGGRKRKDTVKGDEGAGTAKGLGWGWEETKRQSWGRQRGRGSWGLRLRRGRV